MKIVIVGGGFAGLNLAKRLVDEHPIEVTLLDKNNYHFFPPLIYQVATTFIEPTNISYPFRTIFQKRKNLKFWMGELKNIDTEKNVIETTTGNIPYDYLVLGMGTETNYFGMENVKQNALPLKTIDDAINLRNHILLNVEEIIRTADPVEKNRKQNIVIAGGGPTGVEVAGMFAEMASRIVKKDYPELASTGQIYIVDALGSLLGPMSKKSQEEAYKVLDKLGVQIKLNVSVKDYIDGNVLLSSGEQIPTDTLIWTSGVIAREAPGLPKEAVGRGRRLLVDAYNKVVDTENIFAIGDQCLQSTDINYPNGHPQLAQVAMQQGKLLAANFKRMASGKELKPFQYQNKGSMAFITKFKAVADLPKLFVKGFLAWLVWLFIHLIPIAGFRNKLRLAYNWAWAFSVNRSALRLIIRPDKKQRDI
ncbi:NAD(P)/FAD-dependent oxidoreductase [Sphingobacterium olei]|uniref:NADH:ubiquinone reductase (non-electrogenic) n=1 Tax=Sphingobacterium olei TaxID=2571155 RepID=A0A4U0NJ22_9SPHI|nr:NAD(P)/FAD-dependent oxidoreductase [Sphingobacterium olei]TJZ53702.1 NAD(P)/FAD-dependent oxidoreductase [Sphingobacterium olei]